VQAPIRDHDSSSLTTMASGLSEQRDEFWVVDAKLPAIEQPQHKRLEGLGSQGLTQTRPTSIAHVPLVTIRRAPPRGHANIIGYSLSKYTALQIKPDGAGLVQAAGFHLFDEPGQTVITASLVAIGSHAASAGISTGQAGFLDAARTTFAPAQPPSAFWWRGANGRRAVQVRSP